MGDYQALRERTLQFSVSVVGFCRGLPSSWPVIRIAGQLMDAGTSVGANYRAACRARSRKEFIAKIGVVIEEADECEFWCALLQRCGLAAGSPVSELAAEAGELLAIFIASRETARSRIHQRDSGP